MVLEGKQLELRYGTEQVLHGLDVALEKEQVLAILGRSGCGKTSLLKAIAGLLPLASGQVLLNGVDVSNLPANQRGIVYLYQEALLFPHLNVFENIAFGLRIRREPEDEIRNRVSNMLENLDLKSQQNKMPEQLSGGQKQRVAFGRALIIQPPVLLLDEPFGNLDVETRSDMQQFFKTVAAQFQISALFVTHDLKEALIMGDQLGYMDRGVLDVFPDKEAFYSDPRTGMQGEMDFWEGLRKDKKS
ncbi:MAG: ABC transporter ATP-binding protein [Saprospiraceae bacterium]